MKTTKSTNATANLTSGTEHLRITPLESADQIYDPPAGTDLLEIKTLRHYPYVLGFAVSERAIEETQRLRYQVFTREMGCGADQGPHGIDRDRFDAQMAHLVLLHRDTEQIVGTYRLQTIPRALATAGAFTAGHFHLEAMDDYLHESIELGRLCIARDHRGINNLALLFHGVQTFIRLNGMRYAFGCCSVRTEDPLDGWRVNQTLHSKGYLAEGLLAMPVEECFCGDPWLAMVTDTGETPKLPRLFDTYMSLGAKVVSYPARDAKFGTVDFLVLIDSEKVRLPAM